MEPSLVALWLETTFVQFDLQAAKLIHGLYDLAPGFFTPFFRGVSLLGKGGVFLILLSLVLLIWPKTRRCGTAMLLGLAIGALVTNLCIKPIVSRIRPYMEAGRIYYDYWLQMGQHTESDFCFPSGHMTAACAASMAFFLAGKRKRSWLIFLLPVLMGVSRIYLSVHYCSDVLGGLLVGCVAGLVGYLISRLLPDRWYTAEWLRKKEGREDGK